MNFFSKLEQNKKQNSIHPTQTIRPQANSIFQRGTESSGTNLVFRMSLVDRCAWNRLLKKWANLRITRQHKQTRPLRWFSTGRMWGISIPQRL